MRRKDREIKDRAGLEAILGEADACRIAFAAGGEPYIVALNYGYEWSGELPLLFFHCAREGRKLDMMRAAPRVCFELDAEHELVTGPEPCDWGMGYASVVGYGALREIDDEPGRLAALGAIMSHYGWNHEGAFRGGVLSATTVLELRVTEMTGKRKTA
jgi:nitroimidazol reductase NimA-like FMN-containing flavoprotein (pyridoxamine 5'-phosphate oxidase superfamily)